MPDIKSVYLDLRRVAIILYNITFRREIFNVVNIFIRIAADIDLNFWRVVNPRRFVEGDNLQFVSKWLEAKLT